MINDEFTEAQVASYLRKRLICPLVLAEYGVFRWIAILKNEQLVERLHAFGQQIQDDYWQQITHGDNSIRWEYISASLNRSLSRYYKEIPKLLLTSISDLGCLGSIAGHTVTIPSDARIDWKELVHRFLALEGEREEPFTFIPAMVLELHKTTAFLTVCQQLFKENKSFDEEIMWRSWQQYAGILTDYGRLMYDRYWEIYDQPPIYKQLNRLQHKIASLRFRLGKSKAIGVPSALPNILKDTFDKQSYIKFIREDLDLHELKEQELITLKRLENNDTAIDQIDAEDDSNNPPPPPVTPPPALAIAPEQCDPIINALKPYVSSGLTALKTLLAGEAPDEFIVFKERRANNLIFVFEQARKAGYINDAKTVIARWLIYWFRVEKKGIEHEMNYNSVYDVLSKKKAQPVKSRRLPYKP